MSFKVGDKVRQNGTGAPFRANIGLVGVVAEIRDTGIGLFPYEVKFDSDLDTWPYGESELELVDE